MPSSDPAAVAGPSADSNQYAWGALIVLLVGALVMTAVARTGRSGGDLPLLPPLGGASTEFAPFRGNPPTSLEDGVVAPAQEGPAYLLKAESSTDVVAALAEALGFPTGSEPRSDDQGFIVADKGSDRVLRVGRAPGHPWTLTREDPSCATGTVSSDGPISSDSTVICPDSGIVSAEPGQVGGSSASAGAPSGVTDPQVADEEARCEPVDCPEGQACAQVCAEPTPVSPLPEPVAPPDPIELPPADQAERRGREILDKLGLEVARTTLTGSPDGLGWQVLAELSVGGLTAVGLDTNLVIGEGAEVVAGSGMVPDVELLGRYPLVDASQVLQRLQAVPGISLGGPEPALAPVQDPGVPTSIVALRLVLLLQYGLVGDRTGDRTADRTGESLVPSYLVPAFLVDASDGSVFTVPAAADEFLAGTQQTAE